MHSKTAVVCRAQCVVGLLLMLGISIIPVSAGAAPVKTDTDGLVTGEISVPTDGFEIPAYFARPNEGRRWPLILLIHGSFGDSDFMRDMCRRFAKEGYFAIVPDLFARRMDAETRKLPDTQRMLKIVAEIQPHTPIPQMTEDCRATLAWGHSNGGDRQTVGLCTFESGGRIAMHLSGAKTGPAAVVMYSPIMIEFASPELDGLRQPFELVGRSKAAILAHIPRRFGEVELEVEKLEETFEQTIKENVLAGKVILYQRSFSHFFDDTQRKYNEKAALNAWKETLEWFREHGVK
ncbi:MAG: dienelactone hydrolase family protein [Planctomycetales bacterium]